MKKPSYNKNETFKIFIDKMAINTRGVHTYYNFTGQQVTHICLQVHTLLSYPQLYPVWAHTPVHPPDLRVSLAACVYYITWDQFYLHLQRPTQPTRVFFQRD